MIAGCFAVVATVVVACVAAFFALNFLTAGFTGGSADVEWTPAHAAKTCADVFSSHWREIEGLDPDHTGPASVKGAKGGSCYVRLEGVAEYERISGADWRRASAPIEFDGPPNAEVGRFGQIALR